MFKISWDRSTGGVKLTNIVNEDIVNIAPRPVFYEELDLLELNSSWSYPRCVEPLMWACNKDYYYRGDFVFTVKGANVYEKPTVIFQSGKEKMSLCPVDVVKMLQVNSDFLFLCESEAIEFIRDTYDTYTRVNKINKSIKSNQLDFDKLLENQEKKTKRKMALIKEDCDSFDIMPLEQAEDQGKKVIKTTKIDLFLASFSGGKDSQVILDLCTKALPPDAFQVIYSDTGYELPSSLELYKEVQDYYHQDFPTLKFSLAKNHESVLNYWDIIGSPSDKHRWCCAVMKTAPLYRSLKVPGTNKQARVLAFEGVRSEESVKRSNYERIGRGVKHSFVVNARPILRWNTTEVFLYLFKYHLPINVAYRVGKPRVGCIFCPFSSPWDDMIVNQIYPEQLKPFLDKVVNWSKERKIPNLDEYIKDRRWRLRASGNFMRQKNSVKFSQKSNDFIAEVHGGKVDVLKWLVTIAEFTSFRDGNTVQGELNYKGNIYSFNIDYRDSENYTFRVFNVTDIILIKLIKRVLYKSTYCVSCEVCEVECPTGALSVYPSVKIDKKKCIHCHRCLEFHERGCIVADSVVKNMETKEKVGNISKYGTFGIHEEWVSEFLLDPNEFSWKPENSSLGNKQLPSFKSWLQDAEIIDANKQLTEFGEFCFENKDNDPELIWSIIWINLGYNSELVKWFINNIKPNQIYDKNRLKELAYDYFSTSFSESTIDYAFQALMQAFNYSPIGEILMQGIEVDKKQKVRQEFTEISEIAIAYSLYKYGEKEEATSLRVKDFYDETCENGIAKEFCLSKECFERGLRTLNSEVDRILVAELNMGLNHITLQGNLKPIDVLKKLF